MSKGRLDKIKRWWELQWDWSPKKPLVLFISLIFVATAIYCFISGLMVNPSVQEIFNPQPPSKSKSLLPQSFDIPDCIFPNKNHNIAVECNVTGTNFAVGEPINIYLRVNFDATISKHYNILFVEGEPVNGRDYFVNLISYESQTQQCYIRMNNSTGTDFYQHWDGSNTAEFLASGQLTLKIRLVMLPTEELYADINWDTWNTDYVATLQYPDLEITSGQLIQQQSYADLTLSLTYFVLFFASVDIAVVLYDHSEDKDEDKQYEYRQRKAERKRRYQHEEGLDVV